MCRSRSEGGRRCVCTAYTQSLANQNRAIAKSKRAEIAKKAMRFGGQELAEAITALPPSRLSVFLIAADQSRPGTLSEFSSGVGSLPGIHNMVTEDRRETGSPSGKANNSGKLDPHAVSQVQSAVLTFDKAVLEDGEGLSGGARERLERSIATRERALELGLLDGRTMTLKRMADLRPDQKEFYASLDPDDLPALVDVQGRVSRSFWDRHLSEARFNTEAREPVEGLALRNKDKTPRTLAYLMSSTEGKRAQLSSDLFVERADDGALTLVDKHNGVQIPVEPYMRLTDVLARTPRITSIDLPAKASSASQKLVDEKFLDPESRVGANHTKTLRAAAAHTMFASGVPVNNGEDGKAPWQDHRWLARAGLARPVIENVVPRFEGYELDGHARVAEQVKNDAFMAAAKALKVPMESANATRSGSARTPVDARYRGRVSTPQRAQIARGGFRVRSGGTGSPEAQFATNVDSSVFSPPQAPEDMVMTADRSLASRGLATSAARANRLTRLGHNPETVGVDAHVATARLRDAFRARKALKAHSPTVVNAVAYVPAGWDAAAANEDGTAGPSFFSQAFAKGTRVDTSGFTVGAVANSAADSSSPAPQGKRAYRVQYLSTDHLVEPDGTAVIGENSEFRVHSVDYETKDGVPVVRLVSDPLAADIATGKVSV